MKLQIFAVLFLIAGAYALPSPQEAVVVVKSNNELVQKSIVVDVIKNIINFISNNIKDVGLDPIEVDKSEFNIDIEFFFFFNALIENLRFAGISDIKIHSMDYNYFFNRLRMDVSLPEISLNVGNSSIEVRALNILLFNSEFRGSASVKSIRLAVEAFFNVNISGISLRSISVDSSLGGIESNLRLIVLGLDFSGILNGLLNERIPNYFENNKDDINRELEVIVSKIINIILGF